MNLLSSSDFFFRELSLNEERAILKVRRAQWHGIVSSTKTERPKDVPLTEELREVLRGWRQERKAFIDCLKQIEVDRRLSSHGLRRTANDLLRRVATGEVTRAITGHVTQAMTDHYSHVDAGEKRAAVEGMMRLVW